jgi:hypothetical protein
VTTPGGQPPGPLPTYQDPIEPLQFYLLDSGQNHESNIGDMQEHLRL